MAVKPRDEETFVREVDEELRRERASNFVQRYGAWLIGGAVLLLAVFGGVIWLQRHREAQAGEASAKLVQVIEQLESNNARAAAPAIDELAASDRVGYRLAAQFARANAQVASNAVPAAVATLRGIAADASAPQPYRDAALIRQTQLEFDGLNPGQVVERLRPFAQAGNPWFGSAGEMTGIALIKAGRIPQAAQVFGALARDQNVPASIRARAIQMASSLGIDAVEIEPDIARAAPAPAAPAPAAAPGATAPTPAGAPVPTAQGNDVAGREGSQ